MRVNIRWLIMLFMVLTLGCRSDGHLSFLGYSSAPLFDPNIRTVYVPVFKNTALQTTPYRDLEVDITRAVIREINTRSNMRVTSDRERADTELLGTLTQITKLPMNQNQQNQLREAEIQISTQVVWIDLRDGRVLSNPRPPALNIDTPPPPFDPDAPPLPPGRIRETPVPVTIQAVGRLLPELGESTATANKAAVDRMARQIVNMMEAPW